MPSRTNEDKIEDLTRLVAAHTEQLKNVIAEIQRGASEQSALDGTVRELQQTAAILGQQIAELRLIRDSLVEVRTGAALLNQRMEQLEKWREEVKQGEKEFRSKVWMIVPPLIAAVVSAFLSTALAYFFLRNK